MSESPRPRVELTATVLRHVRQALSEYGGDQANGPRMVITPDPAEPCYFHVSLRTAPSAHMITMHVSVDDIEMH